MALTEKHLDEYNFADFLREFQEAVLEGYRLDLDSNERFPQKFGSHLSAILVKSEESTAVIEPVIEPEVTKEEPEVKVQEVQKNPRGRKAKE